MGHFSFSLHGPDFLPPCTLPHELKKNIFYKKSFKFLLSEKSKNFTVIVLKIRVVGQTACLGLSALVLLLVKIDAFSLIRNPKGY